MTTRTIDLAASGATELTDAELAAVSGGYNCPTQNAEPINNPYSFAKDYWGHVGVVGTFRDFWYQMTN